MILLYFKLFILIKVVKWLLLIFTDCVYYKVLVFQNNGEKFVEFTD